MKRRNPSDPQRQTAANARKTEERVEQYRGLQALLDTWETTDDETHIANHEYIIKLRARVRQVKNLLLHRAVDIKI